MGIIEIFGASGLFLVLIVVGIAALFVKCYRKVEQGQALILTGRGGAKVSFGGAMVIPVLHRMEKMDVSVKRIEIERLAGDGLVCRDNMRADIKVAFFVRVNNTVQDVLAVANSIGVARASDHKALDELFNAKFSEALKTAGKKFDFVDLYEARVEFKNEILQVIGTDLNGYRLEDCAIDYLEQTELEHLNPNNILDAEGIKKITQLTSSQIVLANQIDREREKTLKQQDVAAREAILELERQQKEAEEKQAREVAAIKAREAAETMRVQQEQRLKAESARIQSEEELAVAEENKQRQIIVAQKNKQRTEAIENERIEKDRQLEVIGRERVVTLTNIEKEKAVEEERKNIQDVIRERVSVEKAVVEEEEKIKDTRAFAEAERVKSVALTAASQEAEMLVLTEVKSAEAERQAASEKAQQHIIEADAARQAADKNAEARKVLAEAQAAEEAAMGMSEAQVIEAKAKALEHQGIVEASVLEKRAAAEANGIAAKAAAAEKQGLAEANVMAAKRDVEIKAVADRGQAEAGVLEQKAIAEAKGTEAKADALQKQGEAEAAVMERKLGAQAQGVELKGSAEAVALAKQGQAEAGVLEQKAVAEAKGTEAKADALAKHGEAEATVLLKKYQADAQGIREKADAMKDFDGPGREHEEFKLRLQKDHDIELAELQVQKDIAAAQALVVQEGLKSAKIDIVGGESMFFEKIMGSITQGKSVDRMIGNSEVLTDVKETFFNGDPEYFKQQLKGFISQFGMTSEDVKNLTLSALITQLMSKSDSAESRGALAQMLGMVEKLGIGGQSARLLD